MTARARRSSHILALRCATYRKSLISDVPRIVAGLKVGRSFSAIPCPTHFDPQGRERIFYDKGWRREP